MTTQVITPQTHPRSKKIFLAGTIDMGNSVDWQSEFIELWPHTQWIIANPRREDWDSSWEQTISSKEFFHQVMWELDEMERADVVYMYFAPGSQSPITLLELGLLANSGKLIVNCPEGFWRKGNVDIICRRYRIQQVSSHRNAISTIERYVVENGWL